ncbi:sulfur carrier protein ThiS [Thermochromatium tepidum]|jgi:sulfur carrier protein ThiS|uniref:Sulfur carrier protein ThiS n=1 Tax=Thermochromatium tepidum ATCC 43061 TaxID=316276 RepID=A0A6I6E9D3_THETI|nr:sulfur carrier protein ThiS [Thermochromatium tepidum]QGU33313.1 sulfur carrier protein ThiS [Thermochromatium tepidum ATCC 43061]
MQIILNGSPREIADGMRVSELVEYLELLGQRFAIEINAELIPRSRFAEHRLAPGDKVEIIQAVGGG